MSRTIRTLIYGCLLLVAVLEAKAFSLLGPNTPWMVQRLGYGGAFGPVNIHEEYRWTFPALTFGMTPNFLAYFGSRGESEVEKAFEMLSALPAASEVNLDSFPLASARANERARAINLLDLKTFMAGDVLTMMGLVSPNAFVYTLRRRWTTETTTNFVVIKRNFDPVTKAPSSHINGELWTYTGIADGDIASVVLVSPADPLASNFPLTTYYGTPGVYTAGLTRDDMGGLRHIYHKQNYNLEPAATNAQPASSIVGPIGAVTGGGGGSGTAWTPVGSSGASGSGSAWTPVVINTNATNVGTGTVNTNYVDLAVRGGVDKLSFSKIVFDTILGTFTTTSIVWTDTYIVNGRQSTQRLGRTLVGTPDILIHGADLEGGPTDDPATTPAFVTAASFISNIENAGDLNVLGVGLINITGDVGLTAGPGIFNSGNLIIFNTAGPMFGNTIPGFLSEVNSTQSTIWGSFDGSTNAPFVYPLGTSVEEIENRVLGAR